MDSIPDVQARVAAWARAHGHDFGFDPGSTRASHVLNFGGFGNASFRIEDGRHHSLHVKLADRENADPLRRWHAHADLLQVRYRAPAVLAWLELPEVGVAGLVMRDVRGRSVLDARARERVWEVAEALLRDEDLDAALPRAAPSCLAYLEGTWLDCLREDLRDLAGHAERPAWISAATWRFMEDEVARVAELASRTTAFCEPTCGPCHGDLWDGNILVHDDDLAIVDWDLLAHGDPAKDYVDLFWVEGDGPLPGPSPQDARLLDRIPLWVRVRLLVDVVDPLADWAEAARVPGAAAALRPAKRRIHEDALAAYRVRFGTGPATENR